MGSSQEAFVNPKMLEWARKTSGLTLSEAAKKINRSDEDDILAWETGSSHPSIAKARKAAEVYKRPLAVFYLSEVPKDFTPLRDFRKLPEGIPSDHSPDLRLLIRQSLTHQEWASDALRSGGKRKLGFVGSATIKEDPNQLARQIIKRLGFQGTMRKKWHSEHDAFRTWVDLSENTGVFVFQSSKVDPIEARGFALPDPYAPFVFVNSQDAPAARIFTLVHELVHIWLGSNGVSNLEPLYNVYTETQRTEVFCNKVAAEIIVPQNEFIEQWQRTDGEPDLDRRILRISSRFQVSREMIARRLLNLKIISRKLYLDLREEYNREWKEYQKRARKKMEEKRGWPAYIPKVVRENGRAFTRLILNTFSSGEITGRDVSSLLDINLKHIPNVSAEVGVFHGGGG